MRPLILLAMMFSVHQATCAQSIPIGRTPVWQRHTIDDSSKGADGVRLADFNRDGKLDLVTGWEQGGITRAYLHPNTGDVKAPWPAVTVGKTPSVEDAVAVDLDGDGMLDVVSSTEGKSRTLFVHWSPPNVDDLLDETKWTTEPIPSSVGAQAWMFALPLQIDGAGGMDFVSGSKNPNGAVGWWQSPKNPRELGAWKYHRLAKAGWIMSLFARDLDHDGDLDILFSDRKTKTRGLKWLRCPPTEQVDIADAWETVLIGGADKELMFGELEDLDSDGREDVVLATRDGTLDFVQRIGGAEPKWKWHSIKNPFGLMFGKSVTAADFDRDGQIEISMTLRSKPVDGPAVAMMHHQGDVWSGNWKSWDLGGGEGSKFDLLEPVDVDGDGDLDLITCEEVSNLGVFWYENPTY